MIFSIPVGRNPLEGKRKRERGREEGGREEGGRERQSERESE
jgi:hypothetical protein